MCEKIDEEENNNENFFFSVVFNQNVMLNQFENQNVVIEED